MFNFMQLVQFARGGGNPLQMLQQAAGNDPRAAQAFQMLNGKSPAEWRQMAENMCRERGTTPDQVMRQLGIK